MYDAQLQCLAVARLQARKSEGGERAALQSASHRDAEADVGRTDEVQRNGTHARKNRLRGDQGGGGADSRRQARLIQQEMNAVVNVNTRIVL